MHRMVGISVFNGGGRFGRLLKRSSARYSKRCSARIARIALLVPLAFMAAIFPGCSRAAEDITLNVEECAVILREKIAFQDTLAAIDDEMIAAIYRIAPEDVVEQQVYVSTGATAEEIAVFEAADAEAAQRIETAVWQRVADQKTSFADYLPAELPKLEDPFIFVKGRYVVFCVSDHNEEVKKELMALIK